MNTFRLLDVFSRRLVLGAVAAVGGLTLSAQSVPTPPPLSTKGPAPDEAIVELSVFEVRSDKDVGYQAGNTVSGSRLDSRLKDTPAAISAFTPEFLSDIAATNLQDMLGYATNIETEVGDYAAGFDSNAGRDATGGDYRFRVRGLPGDTARDFVESAAPVDLYNVERAEVASGPNSILFGLGSAGGLVTLTGKQARLGRDRTTLKAQYGSWDFQRYEGDYNKVLIPGKLSFRLLGVYQDSLGWRKWTFNDQKRATAAVTVQPFKSTTINASMERGKTVNSITIDWNAGDGLLLWDQRGRPVADGAAVAGTTRLSTTANRYTFSENDGKIYNLIGELQTAGLTAGTLLPPSMAPYDYSPGGPGGKRWQDIKSHQAQITQRFGQNLVLVLGYFHNKTDVRADGMEIPGAGTFTLNGDPNLTHPASDGSGTLVPNPRARELFMEAVWFKDTAITSNDVVRLTGGWEVNLGRWFGRHRIAGLVENAKQDRYRRWENETLVDQATRAALGNASIPEGPAAQLTRRHYTAEGDYASYYSGNAEIGWTNYTYNGRTVVSEFAARSGHPTSTKKDIDSFMLASQSSWFKDRLIATAGYRVDRISFSRGQTARVTSASDPRVVSREVVLNEWDLNGVVDTNRYKPSTVTAGAVAHATKRFSFFYNYSINNGLPRYDKRILPYGETPPPTDGINHERGVMIDFLGDERLFLRATFFKTEQVGDAPINPGTGNIGVDNLTNIIDALVAAGKIPRAERDANVINYNTATIDLLTKGVEVELVANPTRNLTVRLGYSHSDREPGRLFKEVFDFYAAKGPEWQALAGNDATLLARINSELALIIDEITFQADRQRSPFGSRPHKLNGTVRYKFTEGRLRGAFAGGAVRYQGKNFMQTDNATGINYWGNERVAGDVFAGYRTRVPGTKLPLLLQLNVKNISNSYLVAPGRYNTTFTGYRRIYMSEPRSYRLTTTLEF